MDMEMVRERKIKLIRYTSDVITFHFNFYFVQSIQLNSIQLDSA